MTRTIASHQLRSDLDGYLRQVREGTTLVVTDGVLPIAELRPPRAIATDEEARLARLVAAGLITPPSAKHPVTTRPLVRISGRPLSETVVEDREDRF